MPTALNAIFAMHRRSLLWSVMRIVRDPQTAEDLAQETYLRARNALETRPIDHLEGFLYQTARNLALDHQRHRKVREKYEELGVAREAIEQVVLDAPSAEEDLIERERQRLLDEALQGLPVRARTAWALSQVDGWTYAQIAEHLGVSRNTVYNDIKLVMGHCHDALARLERG
ncbi:RNA polymerase sigma factor [Pseudochelatococcus sp. B33]